MDPEVCGELPTHHHDGSKVDEEALRDRSSLRQGAGTELQIASQRNKDLRRWKKGFETAFRVFAILDNL